MDFVGLFRSIFEVIVVCKDLAESAEANKDQCKRFGGRCDILMTAMRPLENDVSTYREALIKTKGVVEEIRDFMKKFQRPLKVMDKLNLMRTSASDRDEFANLNNKLSQSCEDLKLGVLVDTHERSREDILDVRQDMDDIKEMVATVSNDVRENSELMKEFQKSVQVFNAVYHDWKQIDGKLNTLQEQMRQVVALLHSPSSTSAQSVSRTNEQVASQLLYLRKAVEDMASDSVSSRQHVSLLCDISVQIQQAVTSSHRDIQAHVSTEMKRLREASDCLQQVHNDHHDEQMKMLQIIFNRMEASPSSPQITLHQQVLRGLMLGDHNISVSETVIGKGGFGSVYVGTCNGSAVAIKIVMHDARTSSQLVQQKRAVENEVLLMHSAKHPCIIAVYGFVHSHARNGSLVAMELASRGSLGDLLSTLRHDDVNSIPLSLAISWVRDIANALAFLHSKRIVHRDVKAENVLLTENLHCKVTDFGLAKEQMSSALGLPSPAVGTLVFMAPEIKSSQGGNHRSDVYALGITTSQIFNKHTPSEHDSIATLISKTLYAYPLSAHISACLQTYISGCLAVNLAHRYSAADAVCGLVALQALLGGDPRARSIAHADRAQIRVLDDLARDRFYDPTSSWGTASASASMSSGATSTATSSSSGTTTSSESMGEGRSAGAAARSSSEVFQWLSATCGVIMGVSVSAAHIAKIEDVLNEEYIFSLSDVHSLGGTVTEQQYRQKGIPARLAQAVMQGIQTLSKPAGGDGEVEIDAAKKTSARPVTASYNDNINIRSNIRSSTSNSASTFNNNNGDDGTKLFIAPIPYNMNEDALRPYFEEFGDVLELLVMRSNDDDQPTPRKHRGFGFVTYAHEQSALNAIEALHNIVTLPTASSPLEVRRVKSRAQGPVEMREVDSDNKVFVGMLQKTITESNIYEMFAKFGVVSDAHLIVGPDGHSKGCAFVKFKDRNAALAAVEGMHDTVPEGGSTRPLVVKLSVKAQQGNGGSSGNTYRYGSEGVSGVIANDVSGGRGAYLQQQQRYQQQRYQQQQQRYQQQHQRPQHAQQYGQMAVEGMHGSVPQGSTRPLEVKLSAKSQQQGNGDSSGKADGRDGVNGASANDMVMGSQSLDMQQWEERQQRLQQRKQHWEEWNQQRQHFQYGRQPPHSSPSSSSSSSQPVSKLSAEDFVSIEAQIRRSQEVIDRLSESTSGAQEGSSYLSEQQYRENDIPVESNANSNHVYVGGLPETVTESNVHDMFAKFGVVSDAHLIVGPDGHFKGRANVKFKDRDSALAAVDGMHGSVSQGSMRPLEVKLSVKSQQQESGWCNTGSSVEQRLQEYEQRQEQRKQRLQYGQRSGQHHPHSYPYSSYSSYSSSQPMSELSTKDKVSLQTEIPYLSDSTSGSQEGSRNVSEQRHVYVYGLPPGTITESNLHDMFARFGQVTRVKMMSAITYVDFKDCDSALAAVEGMNGSMLEGSTRPLEVILSDGGNMSDMGGGYYDNFIEHHEQRLQRHDQRQQRLRQQEQEQQQHGQQHHQRYGHVISSYDLPSSRVTLPRGGGIYPSRYSSSLLPPGTSPPVYNAGEWL